MKRVRWKLLIPIMVLVGGMLALAPGCRRTRPNVLLITVDTLRADHLSCYGFPFETSPSIDALASRSVLFERAISASACTAPSHASIMTSKYPPYHSIGYSNGRAQLTGVRTLAQAFRDAGYATAAFVSNDVVTRRNGFDQGFDTFDDELPQAELNRPKSFERTAEQTVRRALAWLAAPRDKAFFMWVHLEDPHGPYNPPPPYRDKFHLPSDGQPVLEVLTDESGFGGIPLYQRLAGLHRVGEYESRYAGEIAYADHWIGRLLTEVEARSAPRPVIILLTADHGESFGEDNFYFAHGHSTTPDLGHVPFILHMPGVDDERRRELVSHVDVMPTLLEAAGLPVPSDSRGLPLGRFLRARSAVPERTVYCDIGYEVSAHRRDEFLRIRFVAQLYQSGQANETAGPVGAAMLWQQQAFRWDGGRTWSPVGSDSRLEGDLLAYLTGGGLPRTPAPPKSDSVKGGALPSHGAASIPPE